MSIILGLLLGIGFGIFMDYITWKRTGQTNSLGVFILVCKKSKHFKWLGVNIRGNDGGYFDMLEDRINQYKASTKRENYPA